MPDDNHSSPQGLLTWRDVAAWLSVSPATVREWSRTGKLPVIKFGKAARFDPRDIAALIARGRKAS
jgi:excisionase family DNA binding protein